MELVELVELVEPVVNLQLCSVEQVELVELVKLVGNWESKPTYRSAPAKWGRKAGPWADAHPSQAVPSQNYRRKRSATGACWKHSDHPVDALAAHRLLVSS